MNFINYQGYRNYKYKKKKIMFVCLVKMKVFYLSIDQDVESFRIIYILLMGIYNYFLFGKLCQKIIQNCFVKLKINIFDGLEILFLSLYFGEIQIRVL